MTHAVRMYCEFSSSKYTWPQLFGIQMLASHSHSHVHTSPPLPSPSQQHLPKLDQLLVHLDIWLDSITVNGNSEGLRVVLDAAHQVVLIAFDCLWESPHCEKLAREGEGREGGGTWGGEEEGHGEGREGGGTWGGEEEGHGGANSIQIVFQSTYLSIRC